MKTPDKRDWEEAWEGLDAATAFRNFYGKTPEQAFGLFEQCALSYQEDLLYMPEIPFKFYFPSYISYLMADVSKGDSCGASCFINLVRSILQDSPKWLDDTWGDVEAALARIESGHEFYEADESIYGSFSARVAKLHKLRRKLSA